MKKLPIVLGLTLTIILIAIIPSYSSSYDIPAWVKGVANFWVEGNISDDEFGEAITFLIEQKILRVEMPNMVDTSELQNKIDQLETKNARLQIEILDLKEQNSKMKTELSSVQQSSGSNVQSQQGFSGLVCKKDTFGMVQLTGKYTNGDKAYSFLSITFAIIGDRGEVLDTGVGIISDIGPHETKIFTALSGYSGSYKTCEVQVDSGF